jgi:hypothetical protein
MLVNFRSVGLVKASLAMMRSRSLGRGAGLAAVVGAITLFHAANARAQITYVDATSSNTVQAAVVDNGNGTAPVSLGVGAALPSVTTGGDPGVNQWWLRPFGLSASATTVPTGTYTHPVGSTLFEVSGNPGPENGPRLATTVSGLPAANYEVFVFYWDVRGAGNWGIRASLTDSADQLPYFGSGLPGELAVDGPSVEVMADNASRWLMRASLGVTGPGATSITAYVDDRPAAAGSGNNQRTWYDGIGYRLFFPPGDADKNGVTNRLDYNLIRNNLGKAVAAGTLGDLDSNGFVNLTDFHAWKSAPQSPAVPANAQVPEPGAGMLAACGALVAGFFSRRAAKRRRAILATTCAIVAATSASVLSTSAQAQIVYVDATPLNVTQSASPSGPVGAGIPWAGITDEQNAVDGQWAYRRKFGLPEGTTAPPATGSEIVFDNTVGTSTNFLMEASGPVGIEDVPRLALTVSSLPSDTYDVYVYYWVSGGQYAIRAGLTDTAAPLPLFNNTTGTQIATSSTTSTPPSNTNAELRQVLLGQATGTSFTVYVEDLPAINAGTERSWFDGVGYAPGLLAGDVNGDDLVNSDDYDIIKANFFMTNATRAQGDLTGNGTVNLDDFAAWRKVVPASIAAGGSVPEPTGAVLMGIGLLAARHVGRMKRRD